MGNTRRLTIAKEYKVNYVCMQQNNTEYDVID